MERCLVVENLRPAAIRTGLPSASPIANGKNPPKRASHLTVVKTITARDTRQTQIPRKNVLRRPRASVREPTSRVKIVIAGAQPQLTIAPAFWSLKPRSEESHSTKVLFERE